MNEAILPIRQSLKNHLELPKHLFDDAGRVQISSARDAREITALWNAKNPQAQLESSTLYGAACIVGAWRILLRRFAEGNHPFETAVQNHATTVATQTNLQQQIRREWSVLPRLLPNGETDSRREFRLWVLAVLAGENPAFAPFRSLFISSEFTELQAPWLAIEKADAQLLPQEPENATPLVSLRRPMEVAPDSIEDQLHYILARWGHLLGEGKRKIADALGLLEEEHRPRFHGHGPGPIQVPGILGLDGEPSFSDDHDWMPQVVMLAKNVLVWLHQLSKIYGREIRSLADVPDEELNQLSSRGFNALWLIGLWERSPASRDIKQRMGNPEATASAYSLFGYDIAQELGGWEALENLRKRAADRGIRLSSDMVPNHVGIDSYWVREKSHLLLSSKECPYPSYRFESPNLSRDSSIDIRLEDHYWEKTDAAVVFQRRDNNTGEVRYIYHGNDGTTMPWNDTAQIDFINPEAREAVIQDILHVARHFPVIRFDAAMVLARKHIRRLWHPAPGAGDAIPSRTDHALTDAEFAQVCPTEFWRDVVDRVAEEAPGTLLLAEAFWMMEGYFVRHLGMHRVYNSAFMNMLREQKNREYRAMMKETLAFDPGILQRFVNFLNNPDEETAVDQFGTGDRYFAACTLLATLPGLPMFGHGQVEGFAEKYGMEYTRSYHNEEPNSALIHRHEREIFPLMTQRSLFAGASDFHLFDMRGNGGTHESVFAFSNAMDSRRTLVLVNNGPHSVRGTLRRSAPVKVGEMAVATNDIASVLGVRHVAAEWLLMRDSITNLWFLRSARALRDGGMEISLDGYGRHVFLDFRIERETKDGAWSRLAAELGEEGCEDPDQALRELRLRPLRNQLNAVVDSLNLPKIVRALKKGLKPEIQNQELVSSLDALREKHEEIHGLAGASITSERILKEMHHRLNASASLYRPLSSRLRLKLNQNFPASLPVESVELFLAAWSVITPLMDLAPGMAGNDVWNLWGMDHWLEQAPMDEEQKEAAKNLPVAMAAQLSWSESRSLPSLFSHPCIRMACGVNSWDGIVWYEQEGWLKTVRTIILSQAALPGGFWTRFLRRWKLTQKLRQWKAADQIAAYQLDRLLEGRVDGRNRAK